MQITKCSDDLKQFVLIYHSKNNDEKFRKCKANSTQDNVNNNNKTETKSTENQPTKMNKCDDFETGGELHTHTHSA